MEEEHNIIREDYRPISMWGYFGYELLFSIPLVGLIVLIVEVICAKNVNVKNFAKSYLCLTIIACVIWLIIILVLGTSAVSNTLRR